MVVIVLSAVPPGLRGVLTRWLLEVTPGVFVGHVSRRIRDLLWERVQDGIGRGRALMVYSSRNEQRLAFMTFGHDWEPTDFDGLQLMMRRGRSHPRVPPGMDANVSDTPKAWSWAGRRRKYGSEIERLNQSD